MKTKDYVIVAVFIIIGIIAAKVYYQTTSPTPSPTSDVTPIPTP